MKKVLALSMIGLFAVLTSACGGLFASTPGHDMVYDIQSIEPKTENLRQVEVPMKDFSVVGPVFAQTSINLSEYQTSEYNSSNYQGDGYSKRYKKAKGEHRVMMEGSFLIQRLLLQEAYKKGADAIVNINIEYENSCHKIGVSDNDEYSSSYTHKVLDYNLSGNVSAGSAYSSAAVNGRTIATAETQAASSNANVGFFTRNSTTSNSVTYKFNEEQNECHLIVYGSALSIKYTNAIIPTCNNCH